MHFELKIFLYALYVGFVYASLAFGALVYRQYHDNRLAIERQMGEDLLTFYDPAAIASVIGLSALFCIFVLFALSREEASIQVYVVPLAILINIVQIIQRLRWQQSQIQTRGILIRYMLFRYGSSAIPYDKIHKVEVHDTGFWKKIFFYTDENIPEARCRMPRKIFSQFVKILAARSDCEIVYEPQRTV